MEKIVLADKTELVIKPGAAIGSITVVAENFEALGAVAEALLKPKNLKKVEFKTEDAVTGIYNEMKLQTPLFTAVDLVGDKIEATFGIREKTELEKRIEILEGRADITEGALQEIILTQMGGV